MSLIECENVSVFYEGESLPILNNISCSISALTYTGVIGPNGGGKTTFLKILLGLISISQGSIKIFNKPPSFHAQKIGYVPQFAMFDKSYPISVMDVVLMGLISPKLYRFSSHDRMKALESLERVSMQEHSFKTIGSLSGGQIQRVLLARALICDPKLLLLDEPTSSIDNRIEKDFYKLLKELNKEMTILLVSHDIGIISKEVSDIICINRSLSVHKSETITRETLTDLYNNPVKCVTHHCQM